MFICQLITSSHFFYRKIFTLFMISPPNHTNYENKGQHFCNTPYKQTCYGYWTMNWTNIIVSRSKHSYNILLFTSVVSPLFIDNLVMIMNDDKLLTEFQNKLIDKTCKNIRKYNQWILHKHNEYYNPLYFKHGFKMWPNREERAALKRFLSWPNNIFIKIWNAISTL